MKPLSEQDHYETLEVAQEAGAGGDRARLPPRARDLRRRLAGRLLGLRAGRCRRDPRADRDGLPRALGSRGAARLRRLPRPASRSRRRRPPVEEAEDAPEIQIPLDAFEDLEDDAVEFDGARLRRARLRRGLELDEISRITKINSVYLSFLEEGRFGELPARVYVRGFVAAYAACIGLDPSRVAASYMKGYEAARPEPQRTRFSKSR